MIKVGIYGASGYMGSEALRILLNKKLRQFYLTFTNSYALRSELSWIHYRLLMRVESDNAREFYMQEAVKSGWSTRQLERQINSFFYERLLSSKNKEKAAEVQKLEPMRTPEDIICGIGGVTCKKRKIK